MPKIICPRCFGNGYIKIPHESVEKLNQPVIAQCTMCNSEGEIEGEKKEKTNTPPQLNKLRERGL
jgi:hypothetical protein|tara:strand:- start:2716 stop:2910 length:195 start_codon:yes stop_codon:yes gene_type:complete